jgi:predicted hydrocarbon binding protein
MQAKKKKVLKVAKAKKKKIVRATKPKLLKKISIPVYEKPVPGYEESMLRGIISGKRSSEVTESSLMFNSVLSTITPGFRNLYYKRGVFIGRVLYLIYHKEKRYTWYEESVADLVSFFEKAGFSGITYNVFADKIEINFNYSNNTNLGANMHVLESGIMCGFFTAGKQQHIKVIETACMNNGAGSCHFVTSDNAKLYLEYDGRRILKSFADSINSKLNNASIKGQKMFAGEYAALSALLLTSSEYSEEVLKISYYLGGEVGMSIGMTKFNKSSANELGRLYALLGLGEITIKSIKPLNIMIHFDRIKAKKEFVDISIAFLSGVLSKTSKKGFSTRARLSNNGSSYNIVVTELK